MIFDLFRKRTNNVIPFPGELKQDRGSGETKPPGPNPPKEDSTTIFYRFGITDRNRLAFQMGYSEITMSKEGCQTMIDQITFFMNQITEDKESDSE